MRQNILILLSAAVLLLGCATKGYVHQNVAPVQTKVDQVAQQVSQQGAELHQQGTELQQTRQDVERNTTAIRTTDEKSAAADRRATDAVNSAKQAQQSADQNSQEISQLRWVIANIDDFKVTGQAIVLFPVNSATLDNDDKQQLDQIISNTNSPKRFFVAVSGFTDQTGSADYNLALSKRRADAVAQYLAGQGKVPFFQISTIGMGAQQLIDAGASHEARTKSRRVEVRIYNVDESKAAAANSN